MVESATKRPPMSSEEHAAKLAEQEAKLAAIFGDFDAQRTANEKRTAKGRASQVQEQQSPRTSDNPNTIYVNTRAVVDRVYSEHASEWAADSKETTVKHLFTENDELVPTIPNLNKFLPDSWKTLTYKHEVPDNTIRAGEYAAIERTGFELELFLEDFGNGEMGAILLDKKERLPNMQTRLIGILSQGTGDAQGRMVFIDDPEVTLHPNVDFQKNKSLEQLVSLVQKQPIYDITYPRE